MANSVRASGGRAEERSHHIAHWDRSASDGQVHAERGEGDGHDHLLGVHRTDLEVERGAARRSAGQEGSS